MILQDVAIMGDGMAKEVIKNRIFTL